MSISDIALSRRQRLLRQLGRLFARIDDAYARNDFEAARENNREVAELLAQIEPCADRDDPSRISGVQRHPSEREQENRTGSRKAS
jgi:hypothetical protein